MAREKREQFTSPKGFAIWANVLTPDEKFNKYKVKLRLNPEDEGVTDFMALIEEKAEEGYQMGLKQMEEMKPADRKKHEGKFAKRSPIEPEYDEDGEETGNVILSFSASGSYEMDDGSVRTRTIAIFDAKGKPVRNRDGLQIGGGSILKVSGFFLPYANFGTENGGVALKMQAVQILKRNAYSRSAASYGFDSEDDGWTPEDDEEGSYPESSSSGASEGNGDF